MIGFQSQDGLWLMDYGLLDSGMADRRVRFYDKYGSYIINYSHGEENIAKYIDKKLGNFLMEAAKFSHDDKTAASGGLVDAGGLEAFSPALKEAAEKLGKGETSEVIESPHGFHLVLRLEDAEKK